MTRPVVRTYRDGATFSEAVYSPCDFYRYALTRTWKADAPRLLWIMLNPSTATEAANDPTIERCERRARRAGFGAMRICNIFALRETRPDRLRRAMAPMGPLNDDVLDEAARWTDTLVCAWGVHGAHLGAGRRVALRLAGAGHALHVLGLTRDGHPRHPLYTPYSADPRPWFPATAT